MVLSSSNRIDWLPPHREAAMFPEREGNLQGLLKLEHFYHVLLVKGWENRLHILVGKQTNHVATFASLLPWVRVRARYTK